MTDRKLFILLFVFIFSFTSCASVKNALTGKKAENSDEFLIKKKNPLVLPPNFDDLPEPVDEKNSAEESEEDIDIEKIIGIFDDDENQQSSQTSSVESNEQFVLDNINID